MNGYYQVRDFPGVRGLQGFPDDLIRSHLKLYEGYVKNVNLLTRRLAEAEPETPEWAEMKRRVGFEMNGMRLHELYFENLSSDGADAPAALKKALDAGWGSFKAWKSEFSAMGRIRGVGWVLLYMDPVHSRLSNHWIGLHEEGHPAGFVPLLVMDVWEHAYTGMGRVKYIEAFFGNIDWVCVTSRLLGHSAWRAGKSHAGAH